MSENSVLTKEIDIVKNTNEKIIDVTKEMKQRCFSKIKHYEKSLKRVAKEGNIYVIEFADGYTAFTKTTRKARRIGEVIWYSKIALEEKANGYDLNHYIEEFKQNNIVFNGKDIPEFIDTKKDIAKKEKQEVK